MSADDKEKSISFHRIGSQIKLWAAFHPSTYTLPLLKHSQPKGVSHLFKKKQMSFVEKREKRQRDRDRETEDRETNEYY